MESQETNNENETPVIVSDEEVDHINKTRNERWKAHDNTTKKYSKGKRNEETGVVSFFPEKLFVQWYRIN